MSTTGSLQYNYMEVHNEQTSMAMQVHAGTDPVMNQGGGGLDFKMDLRELS